MARQDMGYGSAAKLFHWATVLLLAAQFPLGWLMPDIKRGMQPGMAMDTHISIGLVILALVLLRFAWRLLKGVPPEASLPAWQRLSSEAVHLLLYLLVFATTSTGWIFASMRGWSIHLFGIVPLPALVAPDSPTGRAIGRWHETLTWVLLVVIGVHVLAALVHLFVYRDRVMERMLPRFGRTV